MRKRWVFSILILLTVFALTTASAGAQTAPSAIPTNDNFANARPIKIGKSYTVEDIENATVELGQPTVSSCGSATIIQHSVWFSFYLTQDAIVYFSTEGSLFRAGSYEMPDTVLAVFSGSGLGSLSQIGCSDDADNLFSELTLSLWHGTTFYVLVGSYTPTPLDASSVLKLNTRVKSTLIYFDNDDFESALTPDDWTVKNATGDGRICSSVQYPPFTGLCAFRFVSGPAEASKLKQTLPFPTYFAPRKNGVLLLTLFYGVKDAQLGPAKVTLKAAYTDGTPTSKTTWNMDGQVPIGGYAGLTRTLYLTSSKVVSVTLEVSFKSATGTLLVDYPYIYYFATSAVRDGVLPLPDSK